MKGELKKIHSFLKQCFSLYENEVLQLMSAGAILVRLGENTLFSLSEDSTNTVFDMNVNVTYLN